MFQAFEVISTAFVVLSISALILGSIPEFQVPQKSEDGKLVYATSTYPTYPNGGGQAIESRTVVRDVADNSLDFARQILNVIDLLSIAPFYFELLLWICGISGENVRKVRWAFLTVRLLRVLVSSELPNWVYAHQVRFFELH
ncbi:hypothetical protein B9Z55_015224 [Caenorhabditis nigoni]|uniref:Uncharacterized protein n=1 Tax=Caenorhabditis nigoni TaxID=1611254 RepID=A0A2G5U9B2_9PELO|nr:hypothetical protein B9Z55_015224 [Caenorhabditis nigoni]